MNAVSFLRPKPRLAWFCAFACLLLMGAISPSTAHAQSDLTVDITSVSDTTPQQNQNVTIRYRIRNGGNVTASNIIVRFYLSTDATITTSDRYLGVQRTYNVPAGRTIPSTFTTYGVSVQIPIDATTGNAYIGAIVDYNDQVRETNENNNTDNTAVRISANNNTVDLQISYLKITPAQVLPGGQVTVEYRIYNAGGAAVSNSFVTRHYLSNNATITSNDTYVGGQYTSNGIKARETRPSTTTTYKTTITIPANTQPGNYFLGPLTDYNGRIAETDNNNNYRSAALLVLSPQPDLRVDIVSVSDTTPQQGQTIQVRYRVRNDGSANATGVKLRFYISTNTNITTGDPYLNVERTHTINAGQTLPSTTTTYTVNVIVPATIGTGTRYIGAIIDYDNQVAEGTTGENNNTDRTTVNVGFNINTRDLQVRTLSSNTSRTSAGQQVTLQYQIYNAGNAAITTPFSARVYLSKDATITTTDTSLGGNRNFSRINARQTLGPFSVTVTIPAGTSPGDYHIGVYVDRTNTVTEFDETNNGRSTPLTIIDTRPDLQIVFTSVTPTLVNQGANTTIRYYITNVGGGNAGAFKVRFYLSNNAGITTADTYLNLERSFTGLTANARAPGSGAYGGTITIPGTTTPGTHYVGAIIDYDTKVTESNENNNTASQAITVNANSFVDLQVPHVTVDKTTVAPGGTLTFEFRVQNAGNTDINTLFSTQIYRSTNNALTASDVPVGGNTNITAIKAGATLPSATTTYKVTVTVDANTAPGTYWFGPVTDYTNRVAETNNNNNGKGLQITVARQTIDLAANSVKINPTKQLLGQAITVDYSITNKGTAAVASYNIRIYFSTDATITTADRQLASFNRTNIPAGATQGGTRSITIPTTLPLGNGYIGMIIDPNQALTETTTANNTASTVITLITDGDKDGVPNDVDCNDKDNTVYPAYNGKAAATEVCDGKDNDCNKMIDDNIKPRACYTASAGCTKQSNGSYTCAGTCQTGTQSCTNGTYGACTGQVGPTAETCDGKDNNCDGNIDNATICQEKPAEPKAEPPPVETGSDAGVPPEPKPGDTTPPDADCYTAGCPSGEVCSNGACVADPCDGVTCNSDEVCKAGKCVATCGCKQCPSGELCVDGSCVQDPCAGVTCSNGEVCNKADGKCTTNPCASIRCETGRVCNPADGKCIDDPCNNLTCPTDTECRNGQCVGTKCGGETTTEPQGESTTSEPTSNEPTNNDGGTTDTTSTDQAPTDTSSPTDNSNTPDPQTTTDTPANTESPTNTETTVGNETGLNPDDLITPPGGGGCCQIGNGSNQAPFYILFFVVALLFLGRRKQQQS